MAKVSPTWMPLVSSEYGLRGPAFETVSSDVLNGKQAQLLVSGVQEQAQILNRGLYRQGLSLQAGKAYEGYVYAKAVRSSGAVSPSLAASLVVSGDGVAEPTVLASRRFQLSRTSWARLNFSLTPSASSACHVLAGDACHTKTPEGECVRCEGGFMLSASGGAVVVDFAFLQPGAWGRFEGLPVRKDVAEALQTLGVNTLRLGGSTCNVEGWRWKNMRGPREHRQPYAGFWHPYASQGWRIFEFLDLCERLGVQAVVTLNSEETPEDLADLVEYAYGGAATVWGALRVQDGQHPLPYQPFVVEVGNEQELSYGLIRQVSDGAEAMIIRAGVIGMDHKQLRFAIGHNLDMALINTPVCDAMVNATKFLGDRVMWDFHVDGDTPGQVDHWADSFQMALGMLDRLRSDMRLAVFEENAATHYLARGLNRARYANTYARLGARFAIGSAANGLQVMDFNDNGWDQGAVFMAPDRVWFSPFGHVDKLVAQASEPKVLNAEVTGGRGEIARNIDVLATRSVNGSVLALRIVNYNDLGSAALSVAVRLAPGMACGAAVVSTLELPPGSAASVVNSPSKMTRVSPHEERVEDLHTLESPPFSLTTVRWGGCADSPVLAYV